MPNKSSNVQQMHSTLTTKSYSQQNFSFDLGLGVLLEMRHRKIHIPDRLRRDIVTKATRNTHQTLDSARCMGTLVSQHTSARVQRGAPGAGAHSYYPAPGTWGQRVWVTSLPAYANLQW